MGNMTVPKKITAVTVRMRFAVSVKNFIGKMQNTSFCWN